MVKVDHAMFAVLQRFKINLVDNRAFQLHRGRLCSLYVQMSNEVLSVVIFAFVNCVFFSYMLNTYWRLAEYLKSTIL